MNSGNTRGRVSKIQKAYLADLGKSKEKDDVKLHGQLPDYADFQDCDLGWSTLYIRLVGKFMPISTSLRGEL